MLHKFIVFQRPTHLSQGGSLSPYNLTTPYKALPMNFLLVKLSHHLLGMLVPSAYTLFNNLVASSCLICMMYCLSTSAWFRSAGASKAWFSGNPASPGTAKLVSSATFVTACEGVVSQSAPNRPIPTESTTPPFPDSREKKGRMESRWLGSLTHLLSIPPSRARLNLAQQLAHEQNAIDEHAIGGSLDLEVAEEGVGAEQ